MGKSAGQLGLWLREELTQRGYNLQRGGQSRFARETGLHVSIINRVLNEDRGTEIEALRRMGGALGYTLGQMLVFAGMAEADELAPHRAAIDRQTAPSEDADDDNPYTDPAERHVWRTPELTDQQRRFLVQSVASLRRLESDPPRGGGAGDLREFRRPG